mgnify:CR=1 FL=1
MKRFKGIAQWLSLFLLAVAVIAVYKTFDNIVEIGGFFSKLMGILSPFVIGFGMAFLLYGPCNKIEGLFRRSGKPIMHKLARPVSVVIVYLLLFGLLTLIGYLALPALYHAIMDFVSAVPGYYNNVMAFLAEYTKEGGLLEDLRSYAEEFDHNSESLMLFGNAGLGKTHAALAIAGIVLQKDFDVIYVSSPDFFGKLENARFDSSEDAETLLRTASAADLLILDDLGTEFVTPYFITTFYSLLNNRLGAGLPTIVTTNIADGSLLEKRYTEKISSRLSSFVPCLFAGEDIRGLKAAE